MVARLKFYFSNKLYYFKYLWVFAKRNLGRGIYTSLSYLAFVFSIYTLIRQASADRYPPIPFNLWTVGIVFLFSFACWILKEFRTLNRKPHFIEKTSRSVSVHIGDMLSRTDGTILVGVSNTLSYEKSGLNSIQRQLTERYGKEWLKEAFEDGKRKGSAKVGPDGKYPYGYTFTADTPDGKHSFAFIVMSEWDDDDQNDIPRTTPEKIHELMKGLFTRESGFQQAVECKERRLYMPLLGAGTARLRFPKQTYAEWIVREFIDRIVHDETCPVNHLVIEFRPKTLEEQNFNYPELNANLSFYAKLLHHPDDIWKQYHLEEACVAEESDSQHSSTI